MKKYILSLLLFFVFTSNFANGLSLVPNDYQTDDGGGSYTIILKSYEKASIDGILDIEVKLTILDTIEFNKKFTIQTTGFFTGQTLRILSNQSYLPGDTILLQYQVSYDTSNLPFYPEKLVFKIQDSILSVKSITFDLYAMVYFTPWRTVEVWHLDDYYSLKRLWHVPEGTTPSRVYIDKNTIPESDITDSLIDTTGIYYQRQFPGLAFDIPFNQPDTFNWENPQDSNLLYKADDCGPGLHRFTGILENFRVFTSYIPNRSTTGDTIKLFLRKAKVELRIDRWPDQIIRKLKTDDEGYIMDENGNRHITFSFCTGKGKTQKDIYLSFSMCDPDKNNQLRVKWEKNTNGGPDEDDKFMRYMTRNTIHHTLQRSLNNPDISDFWGTAQSNGDTEFELAWNDLGAIYSLAKMAFDFTNQELEGADKKLGPNLKIRVTTELTGFDKTPHTNSVFENIVLPSNRLVEETIFHEFGHYVFYHMYGRLNWTNSSGTHFSYFNNHTEHMTMSEGVASGFSAIMDEMTWAKLGHISDERNLHQRTNFRKRIEDNIVTSDLNSPYLAESYLSSVLLDLWDGTENYDKYSNTSASGPNFQDNGYDNFEMPFKEIIKIFCDNRGNLDGIEDFYNKLVDSETDCYRKEHIKRIFQYNASDITSGPPIDDASNFPEFNSDEIFEMNYFKDIGFSFKTEEITPRFEKDNDITQRRNITDLNSSNLSYNIGSYSGASNSIFNWKNNLYSLYISDNLNISNNAKLEINSNNQLRFFNNSGNSSTILGATRNFGPITTNVCGSSTISIFDDGELKVGDISNPSSNSEAVLKILSGSSVFVGSLDLNKPAILKINNNSKLTIEEGAILYIYPGSRIILNGDNAVLEIKGTLNVHANATFTFEGGTAGSGHVVFNTTGKNNIILGNNSKIRLVGTGVNDRVMEVPADAIFWPDNVQASMVNSSFEIQDGLIALGHNAILNIGTAINLSHVRLYAESCCPAKGMVLWGQKNSFSFVTMENVTGGIESHNTVGGNRLLMSVVKVSGADRALLSEGKGATIGAFESDENPLGIQIMASDWPNTLTTPNIHGATSFGTTYTGSPASNLWIKRANYTNNNAGIDFTGKGSLILSCGKFWNVSLALSPNNGITQRGGGNLVAADALGYGAGRLSFKDNRNSIVLTKTQPYINNGYNNFSYISSLTGINLALRGNIALKPKPSTGYTLNAANNYWDGTHDPTTTYSGTGSYQNYNLTYQRTPASTPAYITIPDLKLALLYINTEQSSRCASTGGAGTAGTGSGNGTLGTAMVINTTHFINTNLQDAVGTVLGAMYDTTTQNSAEVIGLWAELLTEPTYLTPYNEEDYFYIDLAENKMMEALGRLLLVDTTLESSQSNQAHFETVMDVQDAWITTLQNDTAAFSVSLKNMFNFDKGAVYHLEGLDLYAESQWSDMQSWANNDYLDHTDYWLCQLTREAALKNCGNNPDSLANIPQCQYTEEENSFILKDPAAIADSKNDTKISKHLVIYPNPASTLVTAELETTKNETATIAIYSADGQCIKTLPSTKLHNGINKLNIPIFDIAQGVYTITIETKTIKWNDKVIIK